MPLARRCFFNAFSVEGQIENTETSQIRTVEGPVSELISLQVTGGILPQFADGIIRGTIVLPPERVACCDLPKNHPQMNADKHRFA